MLPVRLLSKKTTKTRGDIPIPEASSPIWLSCQSTRISGRQTHSKQDINRFHPKNSLTVENVNHHNLKYAANFLKATCVGI